MALPHASVINCVRKVHIGRKQIYRDTQASTNPKLLPKPPFWCTVPDTGSLLLCLLITSPLDVNFHGPYPLQGNYKDSLE